MSTLHQQLAALPQVDEVLRRPAIAAIDAPRWALVEAVRRVIDARRAALRAGRAVSEELVPAIAALARALAAPSLTSVINATGVVLHTNLGRAPLPKVALDRLVEVASGYCNLEYDLQTGRRGSRYHHLLAALGALTGAEDAVVVNNNAAAVLLALAALAAPGEVVVSRGELVEIGGSFRIPEVMRSAGVRLVEVGCTNRTHLGDYQAALATDTAALLKVHRSNFAMHGFVAEVGARELAWLGRERGVMSMMDLGAGSLLEAELQASFGLPAEPSVGAIIASGIDVVTFSGDKLLGGPQAGILAGRGELIERCRRHPLMRALRPDKLVLAALEATLSLYRDGMAMAVPTVAMLAATEAELEARAQELLQRIGAPAGLIIDIRRCDSAVGGGSMPTARPASFAVTLAAEHVSAAELDARLRAHAPPVIGRLAQERVLLDVRTLPRVEERAAVARAVRGLSTHASEPPGL